MRIRDLIAVVGIVLAFTAVADFKYRHPDQLEWLRRDNNQHLGAEYDEIARAVRSGRGFSDPFREPSGPTAWMPPVLPYVLAGLYWAADDDRQVVEELIVSIKTLVLVLTGLLVVREGRRLGHPWLTYLILIGGFATHFYRLFQCTHDVWLLLLVVNLIWLGIGALWTAPKSTLAAVAWRALGGMAALCSPIAGAVWALVTTLRWRPRGSGNRLLSRAWQHACKPLAIVALCSMIVVAPWIVRNRIVLGAWIPIKSNGPYEIWQALCLDDDGVVDFATGISHPWRSRGEQRTEYIEQGEMPFLAARWPMIRKVIREHPGWWPEQSANRLLAATIVYQPTHWEQQRWRWDPATQYAGSRQADDDPHTKRPWRWIPAFKYATYVLPFLCLLIALWLRKAPLENGLVAAMWIYGAYLLPYVLISYYDRYALPLLGIKMVLAVYGVDTVIDWLKNGWRLGTDYQSPRNTSSSGIG